MVKEYEPSPDVVAAHSILHIDPLTMQPIENPQWMGGVNGDPLSYVASLVGIPAVLCALGLLSVILHFVITKIIFICCCKVSAVAPSPNVEALKKKKNLWKYICFGTIFVIFITDCFIWLGNGSLSQSMDDISQSAVEMGQIFQGPMRAVARTGKGAGKLGVSLELNCMWHPDLEGDILELSEQAKSVEASSETIQDMSDTIDIAINNFKTMIDSQKSSKDLVVGAVFAVFLILCMLNTFCVLFKKSCLCLSGSLQKFCSFMLSYFTDFLNYLIIIVLVLICSALMILVMFFGDFCIDPLGSIKSFLPTNTGDTLSYFAECKGRDPMGQNSKDIDFAMSMIITLQSAVLELEKNIVLAGSQAPQAPQAPQDPYQCSSGMTIPIQEIQGGLADLTKALGCKPIQETWDMLINQALCTSGFSGLYQIWGDMYFMALFFFVFMCFIVHYSRMPDEPNNKVAPANATIELTSHGGEQQHENQKSHVAPHHFG